MNRLLREIQKVTEEVIEKEVGQKVVLLDDEGREYDKSALNPENDLMGFLVSESLEYDINTGTEVLVDAPVLSLPLRALERIPQDGEKWIIRVQTSPFSEDLTSFTLSGPPKNAKTIGYINLKLQIVGQN
jgi:hypothetical protein